jgi:hypothetical protein
MKTETTLVYVRNVTKEKQCSQLDTEPESKLANLLPEPRFMTIGLKYLIKAEEFYLLGYNAVWSVESKRTFRSNMSPSSSGSKGT